MHNTSRRGAMSAACLAFTLVYCPYAAWAQDGVSNSFEELTASGRLVVGEEVQIIDALGFRFRGDVSDLNASTIVLTDGRDTLRFAESDVSAIERRDELNNGITLGVGAGLGVFASLCAASGTDAGCIHLLPSLGLLWAGIGAFVGWMVDENIRETLYRTPRSARLVVAPAASTEHVGVQLSMGW